MVTKARRDKKRTDKADRLINKNVRANAITLLLKAEKANELTEEEAQLLLRFRLEDIKMVVQNLDKTVSTYLNVFEGIVGEINCEQFQMIGMDLANIQSHIKDLNTSGPKAAHRNIPLEESEISADDNSNVIPMAQPKVEQE